MKIKSCEPLEKSTVALTVEVDAADFEAAIETAYKKERGKLKIPGFRPGKAPRKMIERMYGEGVFYEEAVNEAMPKAYEEAVKEQGLRVVGYPKAELLEVGKEGFSFKATVAVYPEVTLGQYKGVEAPKAQVSVSDEDVENRLKDMAERNSRVTSVERPAENGDIVNIDFKGFLDGVPFEGGEGTDFDLTLGSGQFVPGFEEQVTGMSAGEERDINITFPEDYHENLAGKAVVFHVKANAVKNKEIPELDDDFAMDVSEFDTMDELRADIRRRITEDREAAAKQAFEDAAAAKVAEGIQCEIPDAMVEEAARRMVEGFKQRLESQGLRYADYMEYAKMDDAGMLEKAWEPALLEVRRELAVDAVAKAEDIQVSDEEVEAEYKRLGADVGLPMDVESLKKYVSEEVVREQVRHNKALELIAANAVPVAPEAAQPEASEGDGQPEDAPSEP